MDIATNNPVMVSVYSNDSGVVIAYTLKLTKIATANLSAAITDAIVAKAGNVSIGNYSVDVSSVAATGTLSVCVELSHLYQPFNCCLCIT